MKKKFYFFVLAAAAAVFQAGDVQAQANVSLSNLSLTAVNTNLLPASNAISALGGGGKQWKSIYLSDGVYFGGFRYIHYTGTLSLQNAAFGYATLGANSTGYNNTAVGSNALRANASGFNNIAIGFNSIAVSVAGHNNVAVGAATLYHNTAGVSNTAVGNSTLTSNTTGSNNMGLGANALGNNTTGSANIAIGNRALYSNTTNSYQVAIGDSALFSTNGGASHNVAIGSKVLYANLTGTGNTGIGFQALKGTTNGSNNTAIGFYAAIGNTTGEHNTATGFQALESNTTGNYNTAYGTYSLWSSGTGSNNTAYGCASLALANTASGNSAFGNSAMLNSYNGSQNTAVGYYAMTANTTGQQNTAIGSFALQANKTGANNTGLGAYTTVTLADLSNTTMVGYGATGTASNQVTIGSSTVTAVRGAAAYVVYSDGRYKKDVQANVPGLAFIKELRPVTYHYNIHGINDRIRPEAVITPAREGLPAPDNRQLKEDEAAIVAKEQKLYTGFIAQEVEATAKKMSYDFSGLYKPQNEKDLYGLSYSDFVVPLVKSVQQLSDSNEAKNAKIDSMNTKIASLESRLDELTVLVRGGQGSLSLHNATLAQNVPNPVRDRTVIAYSLPGQYGRAKLMLTDMAGRVLRTVPVTGSGSGNLSVDTSGLSAGVYNYSLYIDGSLVSAKQMIIAR